MAHRQKAAPAAWPFFQVRQYLHLHQRCSLATSYDYQPSTVGPVFLRSQTVGTKTLLQLDLDPAAPHRCGSQRSLRPRGGCTSVFSGPEVATTSLGLADGRYTLATTAAAQATHTRLRSGSLLWSGLFFQRTPTTETVVVRYCKSCAQFSSLAESNPAGKLKSPCLFSNFASLVASSLALF